MATSEPSPDPSDADLGRKAVELGLITERQLRDALSRLASSAETGAPRPKNLKTILLQLGLLTERQLKALNEDTSAVRKKFGKYTIVRQLGKGGMGVVFEAIDAALGRTVALKMLLAAPQTDPKETALDEERFLREARMSANLPKHPGIVGVYESGALEGRRYIAMEYIEGSHFEEWCRKNTGSLRSQISILRDAALAVDHAHRHGIIHRDLKPQNVLVDTEGRPHVTDFGLAKHTRQDASLTLTGGGKVMGTPTYISPEQASGKKDVDRRTDVWALGIMLFELLAGRPPFRGETPIDVMMKVSRDPVPSPSAAARIGGRRAFDAVIEQICLKALAKTPQERYSSAKQFADDLSRWLKGDSIVVAVPRRSARRPTVWIATAIFLAIAGSVLVMVLASGNGDRAALDRKDRAAEFVAQGQRLMNQGKYADALVSFVRAQETDAENPAAAAGKNAAERKIALGSSRLEAPSSPPPVPAAPAAQDLVRKALEFTRANPKDVEGQIRVWREARAAASGTPAAADAGRGLEEALARSRQAVATELEEIDHTVDALREADDFGIARDMLVQAAKRHDDPEWIAAIQSRQIDLRKALEALYAPIKDRALEARKGNDAKGLQAQRSRVARWKWPDFLTDLDEALNRVEPLATPAPPEPAKPPPLPSPGKGADLTELSPLQGHHNGVCAVAMSADGKFLLSASWDQSIRLWTLPTRAEKAKLADGTQARSVAFSPDGKWLSAGLGDGRIRIWDAAKLQARTFTAHAVQVLGLAFAPDSRILASASTDGTARLWDPITGIQKLQLDGHSKGAMCIAWSPDGKLLSVGTADRQVKLWDVATGRERRSLTDGIGGVTLSVAFSGNGKFVAGAGDDAMIHVWEVETGRRRDLKGHTKEIRAIAWSADGAWIASASADESLRLWDAVTGECQAAFSDSASFYGTAISRSIDLLAGGSGGGAVRLWDLAPLRASRNGSK